VLRPSPSTLYASGDSGGAWRPVSDPFAGLMAESVDAFTVVVPTDDAAVVRRVKAIASTRPSGGTTCPVRGSATICGAGQRLCVRRARGSLRRTWVWRRWPVPSAVCVDEGREAVQLVTLRMWRLNGPSRSPSRFRLPSSTGRIAWHVGGAYPAAGFTPRRSSGMSTRTARAR